MTDQETTLRPVIVTYPVDVGPSDLHPAGVLRGTTFEVDSPEKVWEFHPDAHIVRYSDGSEYSQRKAKREVSDREAGTASADTVDEPKAPKAPKAAKAETADERDARNARRRARRAAAAERQDAADAPSNVDVTTDQLIAQTSPSDDSGTSDGAS